MIGPKRLEQITEKASAVFWKSIEEDTSELKINHLDHGTIIALQWQMKASIERYVEQSLAAQEDEKDGGSQTNTDRPTIVIGGQRILV